MHYLLPLENAINSKKYWKNLLIYTAYRIRLAISLSRSTRNVTAVIKRLS